MPRLLGQSSEIAGQVFELAEAKITVGRTPDNKIHIADNSVSSHHAELVLDGSDYSVRDLDSTNGTRVNGEKITTSALRRGDVILFGNVELLYESETDRIDLPLPELHIGVPLDESASRGRPPHFVSSGPSLRAPKKEKVPWTLLLIIGSVLALGAIGYFVFTLVTTPVAG